MTKRDYRKLINNLLHAMIYNKEEILLIAVCFYENIK